MSTSVIHPGTTPQAGRPGRFVGVAAAVLVAATTIGLVFAVNQANEPTVSPGSGQPAAQQNSAELNRVLAQIEAANQAAARAN
ncbi:MAG: hypothetical protein WBZ40_13370, partial [Acidimicrobiia bacterium]